VFAGRLNSLNEKVIFITDALSHSEVDKIMPSLLLLEIIHFKHLLV